MGFVSFRSGSGLRAAALAVALLLLVAVAGCASGGFMGSPDPSPVLSRILKQGKLRVAMSGNQAPLNMTNRSGELVGMEVDLVRMIAAALEVEPVFVTMPFSELLGSLEKGDVDMVMSGVTITPNRNLRAAFVGPYFISGKSILTKSKTLLRADEMTDLDESDLKLAALRGSTSETVVKKLISKAALVATTDYDEAVNLVVTDQVDAFVADFPICLLTVLRYPDQGLATLIRPLTVEPLGIALPTNDPLLVNLMQNHLDALEVSGLLGVVRSRWFDDGSWLAELP